MLTWVWLGFVGIVAALIALDIGVARRRARDSSPGAAIGWTAAWITISLIFGGVIFGLYGTHWGGLGIGSRLFAGTPETITGPHAFLRFINGYVLEAALSLDNLFVISLIFAHFRLPRAAQHAALFWGTYAAIVIRTLWVLGGAALLALAPWVTYIFGAVLLLSAVRMLTLRTDDPHPESNPAIRLVRRFSHVSTAPSGRRFFTRLPATDAASPGGGRGSRGRLAMTPLFIALLMVEFADGVYALGSVPAGFAVAEAPLLVLTSNILAIITVRSMYPALAPVLHRFTYVKASLVFILLFVAVKMFLAQHFVIAPEISLSVIVGILCVGAGASLASPRGQRVMEPPLGHEVAYFAELTVTQARRLIILVVGLTILALSVPIGILLPGPGGIPLAIAGLMILATEFVWARRLLKGARRGAGFAAAEAERRFGLISKLRSGRDWAMRRVGRGSPPPGAGAP